MVDVYLGESVIGHSRMTDAEGLEPSWIDCESPMAGWQAVAERLAESGHKIRVRLWLSGSLVRPFVFGPVEGLRRRSEAEELALKLAPDACGLEGPCLAWLGAWQPSRSAVAVSMSAPLRDELIRIAKKNRLKLACLRPWWGAALNEAVTSRGADCRMLAVTDTDAITLLGSEGDTEPTEAATYAPRPPAEQVQAILTRRSLAVGIDRAQVVTVALVRSADGQAGPAATPFANWDHVTP